MYSRVLLLLERTNFALAVARRRPATIHNFMATDYRIRSKKYRGDPTRINATQASYVKQLKNKDKVNNGRLSGRWYLKTVA